jgi:hypothetical protein
VRKYAVETRRTSTRHTVNVLARIVNASSPEEIIDGTYTTHRKVSCIVKTNAEVGPSRGQSPVSLLAKDVAAQGLAEHGAFA